MLIKKVRLLDRDGLFDIRITDGKFEAIAEEIQAKEGEEIIEGNGALASAPFIEPHIHLDTTLTAGEPEWNKSGTLFEGIERWSQRKEFLTKEDVKNNKHAKLNQSSKNKIHRQSHYYCLLNPHGGGLVLQKRRSTFTSLA